MSMKDHFKYNYVSNLADHELLVEEFRYQRERRDSLTDKIRIGLVALNGASLIALLGLIAGEGDAAKNLGFDDFTSLFSALAFTVGLGLAGWSITAQQTVLINETSNANVRLSVIKRLVAHYEVDVTKENEARHKKLMDEYSKAPLSGFQYSSAVIWCQHISGAAWFSGILAPLVTALFG